MPYHGQSKGDIAAAHIANWDWLDSQEAGHEV